MNTQSLIMKVLVCFVLVALASANARPQPWGEFLTGIFGFAKDTADKHLNEIVGNVDKLKEVATASLAKGKDVLGEASAVGKDAVSKVSIAGKDAIDFVNMVGDRIGGQFGDKVKEISGLAKDAIDKGAERGHAGIALGEEAGAKGLDIAGKIIDHTADRIKENAQNGKDLILGQLEQVNGKVLEQVSSFWG